MRVGRRKRLLDIERREDGFDNRCIVTDRRKPYDALEDDHSAYYFILPSVQDHLKKLKRVIRREPSSEADYLARSIERKIEEVGKHPRLKRSRKKPTKQQLYALNFIEGRLQPQTELLRSGTRRNELSPRQSEVSKNLTESRLPVLGKRSDLDGLAATTQGSSVPPVRGTASVRQSVSPKGAGGPSVLEHERFQRFLDEKRQQVQGGSTEERS